VGKIIREILALLWKVIRQVLWQRLKRFLLSLFGRLLVYGLLVAAIVAIVVALVSRL
jgi:hypothetical protein